MAMDVALTYVNDCYQNVSLSCPSNIEARQFMWVNRIVGVDHWRCCGWHRVCQKQHFNHHNVRSDTLGHQSWSSKLSHQRGRVGVLFSACSHPAVDLGKEGQGGDDRQVPGDGTASTVL